LDDLVRTAIFGFLATGRISIPDGFSEFRSIAERTCDETPDRRESEAILPKGVSPVCGTMKVGLETAKPQWHPDVAAASRPALCAMFSVVDKQQDDSHGYHDQD
jgi:hypothetical protein